MSAFVPGGPDVPPAPIDVPLPEFPAANFTTIGANVAQGAKAGGFWDSAVKAFLDATVNFVTNIVGGLLGLVELAVAKLLQIVFKALNSAEFGTDALAGTVLKGMTGLDAGAAVFSNPTDRSAREGISAELVKLLQDSLAKGNSQDANGSLNPGSAGAEEFLKLVTHMGIEGWWFGFLADTFSFHAAEHLGDIKEVIEQSLGLGRLARRALSAPMKILVEEPYTWKLNAQYKPTKLSAIEYIRAYIREKGDRTKLDAQCALLGHTSANVTTLINQTRQHLAPAAIVDLLNHKHLDSATANDMLAAQGYDAATAALFIVHTQDATQDKYARERVQQALRDFTAHLITRDSAQSFIDSSGLPDGEKTALSSVLDGLALHSRHYLSLAQGEQLVEQSLWNLDQFKELATQLGYSAADETTLELLLLLKQQKATDAAHARKVALDARNAAAAARLLAAQAKLAHATELAEAHGVSIAKYETLVIDGLKTVAQYRTFLVGKGIAQDNIDALATVLQARIARVGQGTATQGTIAAAAKHRALDLAQLERAVLAGHISRNDYAQHVAGLGFDAADVTVLLELLDDRIAAAALKGQTKTAAGAALKAKGLSLANEERAVRLGFQSIAQYSSFLDHQGFPAEDRDILVHLMQAQLTTDVQARAVRGFVAGQLQAKGLSLRELEQAVRAGVKTLSDYQLQLSQAGFDAATQDALVSLLQLHIEQDAHSFALHGHAAALIAQEGLSLADVERAVKQGELSLADYAEQLTRAGLAPADVEVLRLTLAAQYKLEPNAPASGG